MIYLASPYSHPDPEVRQQRFTDVCRAAGRLMLQIGEVIYSPIAHGHSVAEVCPEIDAMDAEFWMRQCIGMLRNADALFVLKLDGWRESRGVAEELEIARAFGIPVKFVEA